MAEPTWGDEELPMLEGIREAEIEEGRAPVMVGRAASIAGVPAERAAAILRRLEEAGYVRGSHDAGTASSPPALYEVELTADGRREIGQWPSAESSAAAFVAALQEAERAATSTEDKSDLSRAADLVQRILEGAAGGLVLGAFKAATGMP